MKDLVQRYAELDQADLEWLHLLVGDWQLVSDLSFADLVVWVADLDDLQVALNQYITLAAEVARRMARPPLAVYGEYELEDDAAITDDDVILKVVGAQNGSAQFLYPQAQALSALEQLA